MMNILVVFLVVKFFIIHSISSTIYTCNQTASCGCSSVSTSVTSRIVGGENAPTDAWGWMISFRLNDSHICGASLLSSQYAVTAAHCVQDFLSTPSLYSILAGTNYLYDTNSTTIQKRTITRIVSHPNYNSNTNENDIAILEFSALSMSNSSKLAFICLPNENQDPFDVGSNVVAIGWGVTSWVDSTVSQYLQQVTVQVISSTSAACLQSDMNNSTVQFCAGISTGGKDTCQGDSGGPLMSFVDNRWVLAGITSYGVKCALAGYPGVYTRVSAFVRFINVETNVTASEIGIQNNGNRTTIVNRSILIAIFYFFLSMFFLSSST